MAEIIQFSTFEVDPDMTQEEKDTLVENIMQTVYGDDKNTVYLITLQEDNLDDYDHMTESVISIASSLTNANKIIANWVRYQQSLYVDFWETCTDDDCYQSYEGIDKKGHRWEMNIFIHKEILDYGLEEV